MRKICWLLLSISLITCGGCGLTTTRPKLAMSLAAEAYLAAKNAQAFRHAPNLFRNAENYFLRAKSAYRRKYFNKAKEYAMMSIRYAERAEFKAVKMALMEGAKAF